MKSRSGMNAWNHETFDAYHYIHKLSQDERIAQMQKFIQHGKVSTYEHVIRVAKKSVALNQKYHLGADERQLVRGAMLHDYYLYDWHNNDEPGLHGFTHPGKALQRADADFELTEREKNMIRSHMWPLTLFHMPRHREAWILCVADKIVSTNETLRMRK